MDPVAGSAANQTAYKWSFASKRTAADEKALRAAREEIDSATYGPPRGGPSGSGSNGRVHGPTLPSASDLVLAREVASEYQAAEQGYKRKRDRAEAKDQLEDMVGPKPVGREGMLEKKRARRENDKAFREKGDDGFEADESTLLGGGDSFKDQWAIYSSRFNRSLLTSPSALLAEMQLEDGLKKNVLREKKIKWQPLATAQMPYEKRTKQRWTCSNSLPNRGSDSHYTFIIIVHIIVSMHLR